MNKNLFYLNKDPNTQTSRKNKQTNENKEYEKSKEMVRERD
jgi:hypothetical protein